MKKTLFLFAGLITTGYFIGSFFGNQDPIEKFGLEINIWVQRLFIGFVAIGSIGLYQKQKKAESIAK